MESTHLSPIGSIHPKHQNPHSSSTTTVQIALFKYFLYAKTHTPQLIDMLTIIRVTKILKATQVLKFSQAKILYLFSNRDIKNRNILTSDDGTEKINQEQPSPLFSQAKKSKMPQNNEKIPIVEQIHSSALSRPLAGDEKNAKPFFMRKQIVEQQKPFFSNATRKSENIEEDTNDQRKPFFSNATRKSENIEEDTNDYEEENLDPPKEEFSFKKMRQQRSKSRNKQEEESFSERYKSNLREKLPFERERPFKMKRELNEKLFPLATKQEKVEKPIFNIETVSSEKGYLDGLVDKINTVNSYFLGVKLNTNYLKISKEVKYDDIKDSTYASANISDLPFNLKAPSERISDRKNILQSRAAQILFSRNKYVRVESIMQLIVGQFFHSLIHNKRLCPIEPNYQIDLIKTMNTLKERFTFNEVPYNGVPSLHLSALTLFKGVYVNRNDNYSVDSYAKDELEIGEGIVHYRLNKDQIAGYPETEWFSTKAIMARLEMEVTNGPVVEVYSSDKFLGSTADVAHKFVFECDLKNPPLNADLRLSEEEMLKSYRLRVENVKLTNVDNKNKFYPLTYTEEYKTESLINKLTN